MEVYLVSGFYYQRWFDENIYIHDIYQGHFKLKQIINKKMLSLLIEMMEWVNASVSLKGITILTRNSIQQQKILCAKLKFKKLQVKTTKD